MLFTQAIFLNIASVSADALQLLLIFQATAASRFSTLGLAAIVSAAGVTAVYAKPAQALAVTPAATVDIAAVKKDIAAIIEADTEARGDGSSIAGTFVRLAWHASGTVYTLSSQTIGYVSTLLQKESFC
jgi:hypothetical protein